jgi:hypothetical protein
MSSLMGDSGAQKDSMKVTIDTLEKNNQSRGSKRLMLEHIEKGMLLK